MRDVKAWCWTDVQTGEQFANSAALYRSLGISSKEFYNVFYEQSAQLTGKLELLGRVFEKESAIPAGELETLVSEFRKWLHETDREETREDVLYLGKKHGQCLGYDMLVLTDKKSGKVYLMPEICREIGMHLSTLHGKLWRSGARNSGSWTWNGREFKVEKKRVFVKR